MFGKSEWRVLNAPCEVAVYPGGRQHKIVRVTYNEDGSIMGYSNYSPYTDWNTVDDLRQTVDEIQKAFDKPVLVHEDIVGDL